jgi:hypothetical protein
MDTYADDLAKLVEVLDVNNAAQVGAQLVAAKSPAKSASIARSVLQSRADRRFRHALGQARQRLNVKSLPRIRPRHVLGA